jgi:replicative DNA helicase
VVFIDYLQLIEVSRSFNNRNEDVSAISRGLNLLAKELNITVVALSQLSRAPELRNNRRPHLSDLRDSGTIEQDSDIV